MRCDVTSRRSTSGWPAIINTRDDRSVNQLLRNRLLRRNKKKRINKNNGLRHDSLMDSRYIRETNALVWFTYLFFELFFYQYKQFKMRNLTDYLEFDIFYS